MKENIPTYSVDLSPERDALLLLDQTALPNEIRVLALTAQADIWEAIHRLRVRGAPAIGIAAAMAAYLAARDLPDGPVAAWLSQFDEACAYLASARPTAVNLFWALARMQRCARAHQAAGLRDVRAALLSQCLRIREEDEAMCKAIGEHGLSLLSPGMGILTHCNAGALATSRYGTALAPVYLGQERGYRFAVFADETRPLLQGARLTAFELMRAGVDTTLLCDNMAGYAMGNGLIQAVLVGADRIAANGDTANKIGTSSVAVLARHYGIPLYVCAPSSTLDPQCATGADIVIEQRSPEEVTKTWYQLPMAPDGVKVLNPAFDVTDHTLITAIITEKGVARFPFEASLCSCE